jgi:hypothetical protein
MDIYRKENNRLCISDHVREQFVMVHDQFGSGIAYSGDTLIVFNDERGIKAHAITPETFKWLVGEFYVLKKHLYHSAYKLGRIDPEKIAGQSLLYVWDDKTVYYLNGPVEGANPATFQELGHYWARDDQRCFFQQRQVPRADAATFRVIDQYFAADQNHIYGFTGKILADYREDPVPLGGEYYVINEQIFWGGTLLADADYSTFTVLPVYDEETKNEMLRNGGAKNADDALALAGFTAYDARYKYKRSWHPK